MKPLHIPKDKRWKSLKVYCGHKTCRTTVDGICKVTGKKLESCPHGDKHRFKIFAHIPGTENSRKTKVLETRSIEEAIKETIDFKREVQASSKLNPPEKNTEVTKQPVMLFHATSAYQDWLKGNNVPEHLKRTRSPEHIADVERIINTMYEGFEKKGIDYMRLKVQDLNDNLVGIIYSYLLQEKKFSNRTFNKYITNLKGFLNWYSLQFDLPVRNCFTKVHKRPENPQPKAISKAEFERLLDVITHENGIVHIPNGIMYKRGDKFAIKRIRNFYWKHLKFAFKLDLYSGLRREELISIKYSNIKEIDGMKVIEVENFKVNKIQNRNDPKDKKYVLVPVTNGLLKVLEEGGYSENANPDQYILAPEITEKEDRTKSMSDTLSRGFNHFYKLVNPNGSLTFRSLRKTYITAMDFHTGGDAKSITRHHNNEVLNKYYIDIMAKLKTVKNAEPFIPEVERFDELKNAREKADNKELEPNKGGFSK